MNKDKLYAVHPEGAMQASYKAISALQAYQPHVQVAAIAILFLEVTTNTGMSVTQLLDLATKVNIDADVYYKSTARALKEYVKGELN